MGFKLSPEELEDFVYWICCLFVQALPKGVGMLEEPNGGHCCLGVGVAYTVAEQDQLIS